MSPINSPDTVIDFLDELLFTKTGQHLDDLQKVILSGTLQSKTYRDIAEDSNWTPEHLADTGSDLWKLLSDVLERKVTKKNIKTVLRESQCNNVFEGDFMALNNVHICNHNLSPPDNNKNEQPETETAQTYLDLEPIPEIPQFYGRITELKTLYSWIVQNKHRIVIILGLKEIGKTTLSLKLIEQIKDNFNYIIRRSLYFCPTLDELLNDILQSLDSQLELPQNTDKKINLLLKIMKESRCFIILDDLQQLFDTQQLAGIYQEAYKNYQLFFKRMAETNHQSCLLLLSQEKPIDATFVTYENKTIKTLTLEGLKEEATEILQNYSLSNSELWITLIESYQGHPLWLDLTAKFIEEFFLGNIEEFLKLETPLFEETVQQNLSEMIQALTEEERMMVTELASLEHSASIQDIINQTSLSPTHSLKVINSLIRRLIVIKDENILFSLNPIFKTYLVNEQ